MTTHQRAVNAIERNINQLNQQINEMKTKKKNAGADMKDQDINKLSTLKIKRDQAVQQLELLQKSTSIWENIKEGAEHSWESITHAVATAKGKLFPGKHS